MKKFKQEANHTEDLLDHLMPLHIIDLLKEGTTVAEQLENVPVMFADIVGFTNFSRNRTPKQVIEVLNQLFGKFDQACANFNCYKVCTIGDCYLAMSYNGANEVRNLEQELINMMKFAQCLIKAIQETNEQQEDCELAMRIGIHVGKIIGGVSGSNIVRYDIYGTDVLIANKMESNGQAGKINVSEATKQLLESKTEFRNFEFNSKVEIAITINNEKLDFSTNCYFVQLSENQD